MVVDGAINTLVGRVLDGLDAGVRARCDRAKVLFALDGLGCAGILSEPPGSAAVRVPATATQ